MDQMHTLPAQVHGHCGGNHETALARAGDIAKYVEQAVARLKSAADESLGSHVRGGFLREGDATLDTIIRFAMCAKRELRTAHCPATKE